MNKKQCKKIADAIETGKLETIRAAVVQSSLPDIRRYKNGLGGRDWVKFTGRFLRLIDALIDGRRLFPEFSIFAEEGNKKEPFLSFSALPGGRHCPGAGACLEFCYSFKAWRYPAAFYRQCQNSLLLQTAAGRALILSELDRILAKPKNAKRPRVDFRLYVDGDFNSADTVAFWFNALSYRPKLACYGYSKSWAEILEHVNAGGIMPKNYRLNLSGGSMHADSLGAKLEKLPITRGYFLTIPLKYKATAADHGGREHNKELRAAYGSKAFCCPGKCGECTPKGHACGSSRFDGVPIIIAAH